MEHSTRNLGKIWGMARAGDAAQLRMGRIGEEDKVGKTAQPRAESGDIGGNGNGK